MLIEVLTGSPQCPNWKLFQKIWDFILCWLIISEYIPCISFLSKSASCLQQCLDTYIMLKEGIVVEALYFEIKLNFAFRTPVKLHHPLICFLKARKDLSKKFESSRFHRNILLTEHWKKHFLNGLSADCYFPVFCALVVTIRLVYYHLSIMVGCLFVVSSGRGCPGHCYCSAICCSFLSSCFHHYFLVSGT